MDRHNFDALYRDVPAEQRTELLNFRAAHPHRHLVVGGYEWSYIAGGQGEETLLILPGGMRTGEAGFRLISSLEQDYRVFAPIHPCVHTMAQLVEGVIAIMDAEAVRQAHAFGSSLGGMLVQCLVRRCSARIKSMIAADTAVPGRELVARARRNAWLYRLIPERPLQSLGLRITVDRTASMPESERAFWHVYLTEIITTHFTKEWALASADCIRDYAANYVFKPTDLADWPGRILLIEADDDQAVTAQMRADFKAMYPQARVQTFHAAGHSPVITREVEYLALLRDFISQAHEKGVDDPTSPPLRKSKISLRPRGTEGLGAKRRGGR